ncbi:MAG: InlB B-repeat-containing protein [Eubacterium sp.]|nr:InlB B-repeat-containing protein [Eubacterium sp.]
MISSKGVMKYVILLCAMVFTFVMSFGVKAYAAGENKGGEETKKYKIEYDLDGGTNSPKAITEYSIGDGPIYLSEPSKDGYIFCGWFYKKDFTTGEYKILALSQQAINMIQPDGDTITLYARFVKYGIDVFYCENNRNGYFGYADDVNDKIAPPNIQPGGIYENSYCEYTGYEPEGWVIGYYPNSTYTVRSMSDAELYDDKVDFPLTKKSFTYNEVVNKLRADGFEEKNLLNLSIKWKPKKIAIRFDKNDDEAFGTMPDQLFDYTSSTKLNSCAFKKKGFELDYWSYTINSTEKKATDGATINSPYSYQESITLKANWKTLNYTVKFDKNAEDATGTMADMEFNYGTARNLTANKFERRGYTFAGWSLKPYTKTINTQEGDLLDKGLANNLTDFDKSVTLYAVWEPNSFSIDVYDADHPEEIYSSFPYVEYDTTINVIGKANEGYKVEGWKLDPSDEEFIKPEEDDTIILSVKDIVSKANYAENIAVYIKLGLIEYPIYYIGVDNPETLNNPTTYNIETPDIVLNNPTKEGFTFKGWTDENGSIPTDKYIIKKGSTGEKMLTAVYEAITPSDKPDTNKDSKDDKQDQLKVGAKITDKKGNGIYKITKLTMKNGKITGGELSYVSPYNKKGKKITVQKQIKSAGCTFTVTSIGKNAFKKLKKVKKLTIKADKLKTIGKNAFKGINKKVKIYVPKKKLKKYRKMIRKAKAPKNVKIRRGFANG